MFVLWENGQQSNEPLKIFGKDAPVDCSLYAKKHWLLNKPGWRRFKLIAKREALLLRLVRQVILCLFCMSPKYKFGYDVPCDIQHALDLDKEMGNNQWAEAIRKEQDQFQEYEAFIDKGKFHVPRYPVGTNKFVFTLFLMLSTLDATRLVVLLMVISPLIHKLIVFILVLFHFNDFERFFSSQSFTTFLLGQLI